MEPSNAYANMQPLNQWGAISIIPPSPMEDNSSVGEVSPSDDSVQIIRSLSGFGNTMQQASVDQMPHDAFPDPLQIEMHRIQKAVQEAHNICDQKIKSAYDKEIQGLEERHRILTQNFDAIVTKYKTNVDNYEASLWKNLITTVSRFADNHQNTGQVAKPFSSSAHPESSYHIPPCPQRLEQPIAAERPTSLRAHPVSWQHIPPQRVEEQQAIAVKAPFNTNPIEAINNSSRRSIHAELINPHLMPMTQPNRRNLLHDGSDSVLTPAPPF